MEGETGSFLHESRSIQRVDGDWCRTEMGYLFHIRCVVKVAVGENDGINVRPVRLDGRWEHPGIDEHRTHDVCIPEITPARDPGNWHVY